MSDKSLQVLPVGLFNFERLRTANMLYVDKTELLVSLADTCQRAFLSRPRRFGKSLTLSTLDAMFSGKTELFKGLAAERWVREQAKSPCPVLRLDMSSLGSYDSAELFEDSLLTDLREKAALFGAEATGSRSELLLKSLIGALYRKHGPVVLLIDEYDKPVLDNLQSPETAEAMRRKLRSFYTVVKGCEDHLRFVMLTGISKFTKIGVFSAINNLSDISLDEAYGALCGYTQDEIERCFGGWIGATAAKMDLSREALLEQAREYYDGFSFDGVTKVYNPFSMLQFFQKAAFRNYWYESGSPSFVPDYLKAHHEFSLEKFRHKMVSELFISAQEIERAAPESFLFQAGYLTIEKRSGQMLTLDYPNREVLDSLSAMYSLLVYKVRDSDMTADSLWRAFAAGDPERVKALFNAALASMPYDLFRDADEGFYKAVFLALLRGAGISALGEVHSSLGRSDVEVVMPDRIFVIEFKTAQNGRSVESQRLAGEEQIAARGYADKYAADARETVAAAFVVDLEKRAIA